MRAITQEKNIETIVTGLKKQLQELAPHPQRVGQRRRITDSFNNTQRMDAFLRDMPRRAGIERWLSHYQRRLYAAQQQALAASYELAL